MEDTLKQLAKEIITPKFAAIKHSCSVALNVLKDEEAQQTFEAWRLRELCLEPLQMALESRARKLCYYAITGLQHILKDERFHSSLETGDQEHWLPVQVLNTLHMTPHLPEDIQVDIMKLLLHMTLTTAWCMNAGIVVKISQVYIDTYKDSMPGVRAPVQAALTQMLSNFVETLREIEDSVVEDGDDMLADFKAAGSGLGNVENAMEEVVTLLKYLVNQLESAHSTGQSRQALPLLLEGIHTILAKVPVLGHHSTSFQDLIWKQLCPVLISLLGVPKVERGSSAHDDCGRGPPVLTSFSNNLGSANKIIYSIAAELVRLVGSVKSLRPVLESLFHRILLHPPPQQRLEALRIIKELLSEPERVVDIALPSDSTSNSKADIIDMAFMKLIMEAVEEGSLCNDLSVCFTSVTCVDSLLRSLDTLSHGQAIGDSVVDDILAASGRLEKGQAVHPQTDRQFKDTTRRGQQDGDGGSSHVNTYLPESHSSIVSPPGSPRPVVDSDTNSESSVPDVVKRITRLRLSDVEQDEKAVQASPPSSEHGDCTQRAATQLEDQAPGGQTADFSLSEKTTYKSNDNETAILLSKEEQIEQQFSPAHRVLRKKLEQLERQNAVEFVHLLHSCVPQLLILTSITEVDEALQTFASNFCTGLTALQNSGDAKNEMSGLVLNADGVYTASIAALKLSYVLSKCGFYATRQQHLLPQSQVQFVDSVLGSGLLLYLSPTWLSELYQQTVTLPLMDVNHLSLADCSLLQLLEDIDGLGSHEIGSQLMYEFRRSDEDTACEETPEMKLKVEAGQMLARCILDACWDGILDVLSVVLDGKSSCGITFSLGLLLGMEGAREETQRGRDTICLSLSGLQMASRLCCVLGLQSKCSSAFAQLANTSCFREDFRTSSSGSGDARSSLKAAVLREKPRPVRLHAAHVLSMDAMMTTGLEVGSHAADCWKHIFRCCAHISELEHTYFSRGNHESSLPRVHQGRAIDVEEAGDTEDMLEMEPVLMVGAAVPVAPRINVVELIRQSCIECGWDTSLTGGGVLTPQQAARALCGLSQEVDSLFEDAARKLNLKALLSFLTELGESSRQQLRHLQHGQFDCSDASNMLTPGNPAGSGGQRLRLPTNALHLYRLQQALLTVVHSPRPLLHLVRVWAATSPYLVEATGHRDSSISKMTVTCIHDFIVAVLAVHHELPHFHINEFLCKTFEDMLCLELCDSDVQDQIVCSICELVEACTQQLQSGWRPLFGALRSVRIEYTANEVVNEARQRHVAAVLDVFEVYLNTDNILVFANATVDCILCLLKYVHGSGMFEDMDDDDGSDSGSDVGAASVNLQNLCIPALGYLTRCCQILASLWKMPACPVFKGAFRIQLGSQVRTVDSLIPHLDLPPVSEPFAFKDCKSGEMWGTKGDNVADSQSITSVDSGVLEGSSFPETEREDKKPERGWLYAGYPTLGELDKGSGVLFVWYLLLDGLTTAISSCLRSFQPQTLTTLFQLLRDTTDVPGVKFSLHCVNHLLLPMLQTWLRRGSRLSGYWETGAVNFKQCCGLTADLVVDFIAKFVGQTDEVSSLELMLKQLFAVLTECVAQPIENLSLLGSSCIRHVMLSAGPMLTENMWNICAGCLAHAVSVTTYSLHQLLALFHPNSDNFYGDIGQVKVATRKDCVAMDNMRLKQLARQVFLLESQVTSMPQLQFDLEEDKSFVFLIYPQDHTDSLNPEHISARVPLRDMVVGLLSNQLLLQTLGSLLLDTSTDTRPGAVKSFLPGLMSYMSTRNILSFMDILESLYQFAMDFDVRPGLKFLLQKVAGLEVAANQYRLAGASMILYLHALTHLCSALDGLDMASVHKLCLKVQKEDGHCETRKHSNHAPVVVETGEKAGNTLDTVFTNETVTPGCPEGQSEDCCSKDNYPHQKSSDSELDAPITLTNPPQSSPAWKQRGMSSKSRPRDSADVFLPMLQAKFDSICQQYIDILAESQTESLVDRMSGRPLFFLLAQPEDISEITHPLLRKNSDASRKVKKPGGSEGNSEITHPLLRKNSDASKKVKKPGGSEGNSETESPAVAGPTPFSPKTESEEESVAAAPTPAAAAVEPGGLDAGHQGISEMGDASHNDAKKQLSKRQRRADHESKVYSVATDTVIQNLIGQYKRRKLHNAMPNTHVQFIRHHRIPAAKVPRKEPVDEVIDKQQQSSIMKDGEARQRSWSELLVTVLQLFLRLEDAKFQALLPVVSPSVTQLICHAQDPVLRDVLAQWFQRLGRMYGFLNPADEAREENVTQSS